MIAMAKGQEAQEKRYVQRSRRLRLRDVISLCLSFTLSLVFHLSRNNYLLGMMFQLNDVFLSFSKAENDLELSHICFTKQT